MHTKTRTVDGAIDRRRQRRERGQSLVEFALVFPIFIVMMMGFLEFTFVFNAMLSMGHATRDAALVGAEAGDNAAADCLILQQVENDVAAPTSPSRIQQVDIYKANQNGGQLGPIDSYVRSGSTTCPLPDGTSMTVPYSITGVATYAPSTRCNDLAGCSSGTDPLNTIGVQVTYRHSWVTPLSNLLNFTGTGVTVVQSNAMRMEPVL